MASERNRSRFGALVLIVIFSSSFAHSDSHLASSTESATANSDTVEGAGFDPSDDPMWTSRLIFTALYGVLFLSGLANVLVLFIVSRYRRMRTVTNILIFNLCLADLVYISFLPVVIMFQLLRDWMFGEAVCKLFYIAESTAKYASVYFVSVLSLDRYLAMCHPHWCKRYRHPGLAFGVSVVGWFVTALLMTPIFLYSTVIGDENTTRICTVLWSRPERDDQNSSIFSGDGDSSAETAFALLSNASSHSTSPSGQFYFVTLTFVFCFGAPALAILFFYFKVLDQLMQASSRAERLKKKREKTYRKVTRMVLAVITCYILCWMPYWAQFLVVTYSRDIVVNDALKIVFNSIHLLPYLNCAVNPVLYSLMTENFRRILSELFPLCACCACERCREQRRKLSEYSQRRKMSKLRRRSIGFESEQSQTTSSGLAVGARRRTRSASCAHTSCDVVVDDENEMWDSRRLISVRPSVNQSVRLISDISVNFVAHKLHASVSKAASTESTFL